MLDEAKGLRAQELFILEKKPQSGEIYLLSLTPEWESVEPGSSERSREKEQDTTDTGYGKRNFHQIQGKSITERVTEHWNMLPRDTVGSPSLDKLKTEWDMALRNFF